MTELIFKASFYKKADGLLSAIGKTTKKLVETPIMITSYGARKIPVGVIKAFGKNYWTLPILAAASKLKEKSMLYDAFYPRNKANILAKILKTPSLREAISSPWDGAIKL